MTTIPIHKLIGVFVLLLLAPVHTLIAQGLKVAAMPSYSQSRTYANAELNEQITVWGRCWGGTAPYTYVLDFGDGSPPESGNVTNPDEVSAVHTYTTSGSKTITLSITDDGGETVERTSVIRVINSPTHDEKVNMAIEKGLLYLYRTQLSGGSWYSTSGYVAIGVVSAACLSFEENGHLPDKDTEQYIYAPTVQRGLDWILSQNSCQTQAIHAHSDGIETRDSDSNGNGIGAYIYNEGYANAWAALAIVASQPSAEAAQAKLISHGNFSGTTYYDLIVDMFDQLAFCQGDGARRGAWAYNVTNSNGSGRYDGSAQQWPILAFTAARDLWGLEVPQWVVDNAVFGYSPLRAGDGGYGYSSNSSWINCAKTAGAIVSYAYAGMEPGESTLVDSSLSFIGTNWFNQVGNRSLREGWAGHWYAMYSVKKGLQLQGITEVLTPSGNRSWYLDMSAWLIGDASLLDRDGAVSFGSPRTSSYMFGQLTNGSWARGTAIGNYHESLSTAAAILTLTRSVTKPLPVAVIAAVGDQNLRNPSFAMDGSGSYHQNADRSIVSYKWDWDSTDGVDFDNPDATGPQPVNPGYSSTGQFTVTLQVCDDDPNQQECTIATIVVNVIDTDIPPTAVAIAEALRPAYTGKPGVPVQLDGSESFDVDDDEIVAYAWDTDGDGEFDDATGATPLVTFPGVYIGQVGLQVTTANGKVSNNNPYADIYVTPTDLTVGTIESSDLVLGVSADISVTFHSSPNSLQDYSGVQVRFYDGDPLGNGTQVGGIYTVDLTIGGNAVLEVDDLQLNGAELVYVYVDANRQIQECDERNNVASVNVADSTPPVLPMFKDIVVSTSAQLSGAILDPFTFTATDDVDGVIPVICDPDGTEPFPVGVTTVFCVATDNAGNETRGAFQVIVLLEQESPTERYLDTVSLRGDPAIAPGIPAGATVFTMNRAFLNNTGHVLYDATLSGAGTSNSAVMSGEVNGPHSAIAVKGQPAIGSGGGVFGAFSNLSLVDGGTGAFQSLLGASAAQFSGDGNGVSLSAIKGGNAPTAGGEVWTTLQKPSLASDGSLLVTGNLSLSGGVTVQNDTLLATAGEVLAREGDVSSIDATDYGHLHPRVVCSKANARYAFTAYLLEAVFDPTDNTAVFSGSLGAGPPEAVVREGDTADGAGGATFSAFLGESINSGGEVVFRSYLAGAGVTAGNNEGLWSTGGNAGAAPVLVAREGDIAPCLPNELTAFGRFTGIEIVENGDVYFHAYLKNATAIPVVNSGNDGSLWRWSNGMLHLIVREGDSANSTAGGVVRQITSFASAGTGAFVFDVSLVPGIGDTTTRTNLAVFLDRGAADPAPVLVMRRGDSFDLEGTTHEVVGIKLSVERNSGGGTGGYGKVINDAGEIILNLTLDQNKSGIFVLGAPPL